MVTWGNNTTTVFGAGTPAAGAAAPAPAGGFNFGAPAPATGAGLFGAVPATPPLAATGFGLGAPAPAASLFGAAAPAPAAGGGLFGSFGAPAAPTPAFGGYGATPPTAPAPAFAATQHSQQYAAQAAFAAQQYASQHQEASRIQEALMGLHGAYSPTAADPLNPALGPNAAPSSLCCFRALLYDALPPGAGAAAHAPKPTHVSERDWNEALARNPEPDALVPASVVGAASLHSRIVLQQERAEALASHAKKLREALAMLEAAARGSEELLRRGAVEHESSRRRLLEVMRKVEIVRCVGQPVQAAEREAAARIDAASRSARSTEKALLEVEERGRRRVRSLQRRAIDGEAPVSEGGTLRQEDKQTLFGVLDEQRLGIERLAEIIKRDVRDVGILKGELCNVIYASSTSSRGPGGMTLLNP